MSRKSRPRPMGKGSDTAPELENKVEPCRDCNKRRRCTVLPVACFTFLHYVRKNEILPGVRRPSRAIYNEVFDPTARD
jgi:hypothetical protein